MKPKAPPTDTQAVFMERLQLAFRALGYDQRTFAKKVGQGESKVSNWVNGVSEPSLTDLAGIARETGATIDWLLGVDAVATPPLADGVLPAKLREKVERRLQVLDDGVREVRELIRRR